MGGRESSPPPVGGESLLGDERDPVFVRVLFRHRSFVSVNGEGGAFREGGAILIIDDLSDTRGNYEFRQI